MTKAYELFPGLAQQVKDAHQRYNLTASGHDFDHDLRVATYAIMIAPDERTGRFAAAAGFCHTADRMLKQILVASPQLDKEVEVKNLISQLLEATDLASEERDEVINAVLYHEGVNKESDTPVQVVLKDADRLANLDADVIIRAGQFQPHILAVDPINLENDPKASYYDPRSVLWDLENCISWTGDTGVYVLRLPKARELGKSRAAVLQFVIDAIHLQRKEAGLIPYPEI